MTEDIKKQVRVGQIVFTQKSQVIGMRHIGHEGIEKMNIITGQTFGKNTPEHQGDGYLDKQSDAFGDDNAGPLFKIDFMA
jgi:hypothetical protein